MALVDTKITGRGINRGYKAELKFSDRTIATKPFEWNDQLLLQFGQRFHHVRIFKLRDFLESGGKNIPYFIIEEIIESLRMTGTPYCLNFLNNFSAFF